MDGLTLRRVVYQELTGKQKEIYNYQKVAAKLADYGFNCIKLDDDWMGADFLAYHKDGSLTLRVQTQGTPDDQQDVLWQGPVHLLPPCGRLVPRASRHPCRRRRSQYQLVKHILLAKGTLF